MVEPIGCDSKEARRYLGVSENLWKQLRARRIIREVKPNWFIYDDLKQTALTLLAERDKIIDYAEETKSRAKAGRTVGSQGDQSELRTPKELLR